MTRSQEQECPDRPGIGNHVSSRRVNITSGPDREPFAPAARPGRMAERARSHRVTRTTSGPHGSGVGGPWAGHGSSVPRRQVGPVDEVAGPADCAGNHMER
ncbi:hypothetical protein GCM10009836_50230 [Pseudonocardia ailaonensis]|uniref:Uncharacterized protein n=1 Tax=Pseudonocardia ailaonensis TaxID=367279 RepID=A0ABN2ND88_9PSEU